MKYRILCKFRPGDTKYRYWVQCRKHWWNKWIEAPVMAYWCHRVVKRGYAFVDNEDIAIFIKENLKTYTEKYKDFTIYPVFNWSVDRYFDSRYLDLDEDDSIVFSYKLKGFTCVYNDYYHCISNDIMQITWETIDEVKKFIDELIDKKEQIKIIKK